MGTVTDMEFIHPLVYLVLVTGVVLMWRGLWGLLDEYILPKNPRLSYWLTFVVGFVVLVTIFLFFWPLA